MTTTQLTYTDLKAIYPALGIKVLSSDEGVVKAVQTLRGKLLPILYTGETPDECEYKALALWHSERRRIGLPTLTKPSTVKHAEPPAPAPVPIAPKPVAAAPKAVPSPIKPTPSPTAAAAKDDRTWVNDGDEDRLVGVREKKVLLAIGWTNGKRKA